jgi:hypothetical protein
MSSGDTLCTFVPYQNEPPSSNYATLALRNGHPILQFDDTTAEAAIFTAVMPQNYSNTTGVTVYIAATATSAVSGTVGWTVEFERMDVATDIDTDSFASGQTTTATTVPGISGIPLILSVAVTKGGNMDSVVAGDTFRIRIKRDVANDTAIGDIELLCVEIRET